MIGLSKPAETERFNSETVTDPKIKRVISFEALGQRFQCELEIPEYIHSKLTSEDWDWCEGQIRDYATALRQGAINAGMGFDACTRQNILQEVSRRARKAVYNQFMKYQVRAGNHEGHEVPEIGL
jgi:hypothetical protein